MRDLAVTLFSKDLKVQNVAGSNLIEINFPHENAQVAAKTLAVLLDGLKDRHLQVFSNINSGFLEEQLKAYEQKLQSSQAALGRFRQEHQLANEEQGGLLVDQRAKLDATLSEETSKLAELQAETRIRQKQTGRLLHRSQRAEEPAQPAPQKGTGAE